LNESGSIIALANSIWVSDLIFSILARAAFKTLISLSDTPKIFENIFTPLGRTNSALRSLIESIFMIVTDSFPVLHYLI